MAVLQGLAILAMAAGYVLVFGIGLPRYLGRYERKVKKTKRLYAYNI